MPKEILTAELKREYAGLFIIHGHKYKDGAAAMDVGLSSTQCWASQYKKEQKGLASKASALTPE